MNEFLGNAYKLPKDKRKEIEEYLDKISVLEEVVMLLSGSYSGKDQAMTRLRNIDLWIDAFIKERPYLLRFRLHVIQVMADLDVPRWPDYVYKTSNHFKK